MFLLTALSILAWTPAPDAPLQAPRALVWEIADPFTHQTGAWRALVEAGFAVRRFDPERALADQLDATDLFVLGSFVSEDAGYAPRLGVDGTDRVALLAWTEEGGTVLQLAQADQTEARPAFLPDGLAATRDDTDYAPVLAADEVHPIVRAIASEPPPAGSVPGAARRLPSGARHHRPGAWEAFTSFEGMRVLLAEGPALRRPALLEGAHGRGRILLAALHFDKLDARTEDGATRLAAPADFVDLSRRWFGALAAYVIAVRAGEAPAVVASEPWVPPPPAPFVAGSFTLAVLPDTQVYAERHPQHFVAQTRWIVAQREALGIAYVLHLGDVTNRNTPEQWARAEEAMRVLDEAGVPYAIAPGNHDYGPGGNAATRETLFNDTFPLARFRDWPTFGGTHEPGRLDSSFHTFEARSGDALRRFLVLALEWGPRESCVDWAARVVRDHPNHEVILITHAYMYSDETRYDWPVRGRGQSWNPHSYGTAGLEGGVHDGQELWDELVSQHAGFVMTLNGHVLNDGQALLSSRGEHGNTVHQMLCNYQTWHEGGDGYLRLYEFRPDGTIQAKSYSPVLDHWLTEPDQQFLLEDPRRRSR